ncbi:MAG: glycosyltransferase family 2 protein [bacterium]
MLISVIMPVHNGEKYLAEAIRSILAQTLKDFEFIIIDDCSTDHTAETIKSFKDPRIIVIKNDRQSGVAASLNKGINAAKGKYVARMDADDISLLKRLETQVAYMEKHPTIGICGTWVKTFNTGDAEKHRLWKKPITDGEIKTLMFFTSSLIHPTVMFRRETLNTYNLRYDETYQSAQDYELWSRAIDYVQFANIPRVLLHYRIHANSITGTKSAAQQRNADTVREYLAQKIKFSLKPTNDSLVAYEEWLFEIRDKSNLAKYTDIKTIRTIIGKLWLSACIEKARPGFSIFNKYWTSPLRINNPKQCIRSFLLLFRTLSVK